MTAIKKLISVFAAVVTASAVYAQQAPAAPAATQETSGVLGKRVAALGFSYTNIRHSSVDAYAVGTNVNMPATANLDFSASFGHSWVEGNGKNNSENLSLSSVAYTSIAGVKPFASATLGYIWPKYVSSRFTWGGDVGVEIPVCCCTSVTVSGGYQDTFKKGNVGTWGSTVGVNNWITKEILAQASVSLFEKGNVGYQVSFGYRF